MKDYKCEKCGAREQLEQARSVQIYGVPYERHLCLVCYNLKEIEFKENKSWFYELSKRYTAQYIPERSV